MTDKDRIIEQIEIAISECNSTAEEYAQEFEDDEMSSIWAGKAQALTDLLEWIKQNL